MLSLLMLQCRQVESPVLVKKKSNLEQLMSRGVLKVVTDFNSTSYFIYRGQPMGYQYEMLQELADFLGLKLEVSANNNLQEKFNLLNSGQIDLVAANLTVTKERKEFLDFTIPHSQTRQVLVQRKPENWRKLSANALEDSLLSSQLQLAGKTVFVQEKSTYAQRLRNLSDEIGDTIRIIESNEEVEKLVELVSRGAIDYTVCDENVAMVNSSYYDNIDISLPVSFSQNLAWAVKKGNDDLRDVINVWLEDFKKTRKYSFLYRKYFNNKRISKLKGSDFFALSTGNISPYDKYIKDYCKDAGWDWRLVASMVYQESRFNPNAESWAGARGLMQLMPATAKRFGVTKDSPPKQQIRAGIMFIQWLEKLYADINDPIEKEKFVLASYNIGPGHVMDARRLAEKNGKNPNVWDNNVAEFLLKKSNKKYYLDPVVKHGYCRGVETVNYVAEVVERFEHYKNFVD